MTTAILVPNGDSTFTAVTQADFDTYASWGIGGYVIETDANGLTYGFGTNANKFSGSPGASDPGAGQPYHEQWVYKNLAGFAHNATLSTAVASGSNGGEISQIATWGGTFGGNHVLATATLPANFPTSGQVSVHASGSTIALVNYTGITSSSLTGCTYVSGSPTGTISLGGVITVPWPINVYATIKGFNTFQNASNTGFFGPLLGNLNPAFTDPNGRSWSNWYEVMADLGDAMVWMGFDGLYLDNEDAQVSGGTGETTWCAGYWTNNYGGAYTLPNSTPVSGTTVAQERAWAQTHGTNIMTAINGGRSGTNGNNFPVVTYNSNSGGRLGNFPGGVFSEYFKQAVGNVSFHYLTNTSAAADVAMITYSSWLWFLKGLASATTAPVLFGDPAFYNFAWITTSNFSLPWFSATSAAQCWTNAIAYNVAAFAALANGTTIPGFTLPANVYISPMIWPLDQTTVSGNGATWVQSVWNAATAAIQAGAQAGMYMVYQASRTNNNGSLNHVNYAANTYVDPPSPATTGTNDSGSGANYTPLGITPGGTYTPITPPSILTTGLPVATQSETGYSQTLVASGGTAPYTWAITVGTLPTGLSLNTSTGVISGTVGTNATSTTFTVVATDALASSSAGQSFTIGVVANLVFVGWR